MKKFNYCNYLSVLCLCVKLLCNSHTQKSLVKISLLKSITVECFRWESSRNWKQEVNCFVSLLQLKKGGLGSWWPLSVFWFFKSLITCQNRNTGKSCSKEAILDNDCVLCCWLVVLLNRFNSWAELFVLEFLYNHLVFVLQFRNLDSSYY